METNKSSTGTRTNLSAFMTELGSVVRINPINTNPLSLSLIGNEALQLIEAPIANPVIHFSASPLSSYSSEVFHYNPVSIKAGNNILADVVVIPSHKTSFSSANLLKKPLAGTSAFGLQFTTQISESSLNLLDFTAIIESAVRSDSKIIYSAINAENSILDVRATALDCFGECKEKEASAPSIYPEQAFPALPTVEIFFMAVRNIELELLSFVKQSQDKNIPLEIGTPWEVISDGSVIDYRLAFSSLNHSTSLLDAGNSQLCWQSESHPQSAIDEWMQSDIVSNLLIPSSIDTELQGFSIGLDSSNYLWCYGNLDFCCSPNIHDYIKHYKHINLTEEWLPQAEARVYFVCNETAN